jgi:ATP-dependent exoDNAse (exonuclease V) beta subunit
MSTCRSIRFIASAGTGKTHQVVSLYQALLFGRPYPPDDTALPGFAAGSIFDGHARIPPERILMLTFTRNAAAEMRSRVTEAIERELAGGNAETEAFCWSLLRRLSGATISTIHSFAQQLLAAHTLFLGLPPDLVILEETDAADLRADMIESTLKQGLAGPDAANLECLCDGRGVAGIEQGVEQTLRAAAAWGLALDTNDPASLITAPVVPTLTALESILEKLEASSWQKSKKRDDVLRALRDAVRKLSAEAPRHDPESLGRLIARDAATVRLSSKGNWGQSDDIKSLKAETEAALDSMATYPDRITAGRLLHSFLTLARHCALAIQTRKRAQGVLDFDDLLFRARDLIQARPDAVPELDVIIIDEAQDNSRIQNDLIGLVQSQSGADMVMCGDTKQTIYGWRGADAEGLPRFAKALRLDDVPLRTSYRSQRGILDWVNDIFSDVILGVDKYGENETLSPCPAARGLAGPSVELLIPEWEWGPHPGDTIITGKKKEEKPRVTLTPRDIRALAGEAPEDEALQLSATRTEQAATLEARAVARRIRLLTTPRAGTTWHPGRVWDSEQGGWIKPPPQPYRFRDILILLRASTRQELYEQALQEEGIPFTTDGKGRGFFARQETLDVSNLLSWLAFPHDRLARLAVLRSPFVALSDTAVALIDKDPGATVLDQLDTADAGTWRRAETVLSLLRSLSGRVGAVELVREAVRLTGYDAILAGTFHGVQRLANLQKLLSWIQARERDDNLNLQETARRLADEIEREREAPDAAVLDPDDDSVRINTVHAAKGLSSPVVMLPDLRRVPSNAQDWILVERDADGQARSVAGKIKLFEKDVPGELLSEGYTGAADRNREDRDHESRRLFYVACTRARDLLVLSGENAHNGSKDAWRTWINQHLLHSGFKSDLIRLRPYGEIESAWKAIIVPPPSLKAPAATAFMTATAASGPARMERYRLPVTAVVSSHDAHSRRLNLAPVTLSRPNGEDVETADPILDPAQFGTVAHRILETLDFQRGAALVSQIEQAPEWNATTQEDRALFLPRVQAAARTLAGLLEGVAPEHLIREFPFAVRFSADGAELVVDGKVDLIFLKNGIWHIVDYKFSDHDAAALRMRYALQLAVYREALSIPTDTPPLRVPRFSTVAIQPTAFKLILLGISRNGNCIEIDLSEPEPDDLAMQLISAARSLHG